MQAVRMDDQQVCFLPYGASGGLQTGFVTHSRTVKRIRGSGCCLGLTNFCLLSCTACHPAKLAPLSLLWWLLRGAEWHSSFNLSVCPSPPVSLCQSFQGLPAQICQTDGGDGFLDVTWGTPRQHNLRPTMQCVWTRWNPNGKSMLCHALRRSSEESRRIWLSVSTFCWAPLEELCIFYLSLEIRLDPDESIGCTHKHSLSRTHMYTHTNGPPSVTEKSAIMEREGRDSWDLHMSFREETTSPTRPGGGNEPAVHGL